MRDNEWEEIGEEPRFETKEISDKIIDYFILVSDQTI